MFSRTCRSSRCITSATVGSWLARYPNVADFIVNEGLFLRTAEEVNRTLHGGGINKNDRAQVMAALLLALLEGSPVNVDGDLPVLIDDINTRTKSVLGKHGKREFFPFVKIEPPTDTENHVKYKMALVRTIQSLKNLSIKSAMNSGTDVLGKFYEVFLRYGNGAKEIGIVLTPRHVTRFAVETIGVSARH
jgi:type I restriction enzyme M protein